METYRSGHNGIDSKFFESLAVCSPQIPCKTEFLLGSKIKYFVVLSVSSCEKFFERKRNYIHGELSEWSKVQHSKFPAGLSFSSPRKPLLIPGFQNSKSNIFMFSLLLFSPKDFASQKQTEIYGDVPKRLKGPHSKCGRSAQTDARVRISPSPPPKKPVIKPIMGFFLIPFF